MLARNPNWGHKMKVCDHYESDVVYNNTADILVIGHLIIFKHNVSESPLLMSEVLFVSGHCFHKLAYKI